MNFIWSYICDEDKNRLFVRELYLLGVTRVYDIGHFMVFKYDSQLTIDYLWYTHRIFSLNEDVCLMPCQETVSRPTYLCLSFTHLHLITYCFF